MAIIEIGFLLVFIGIIFIIAGSFMQPSDAKYAVGGIIGFIPFGFGNDKRLLWAVFAITAIMDIFWLLMYFKQST